MRRRDALTTYIAGEYPSNLVEALPEVHVSGNAGRDSGPLIDVALGGDTGLYHLILGEGQNAFVANGRVTLGIYHPGKLC